jgi:ABC-2 type transport system ATP-binding protein
LTVRENLDFYAGVFGLPGSVFRKNLAALSAEFGMEALLSQSYQTLSTGQKQRANLLRSLLPDPKIIIFDEVSKSLDASARDHLYHYMQDILVGKRGCTVLLVSHEPTELKRWCPWILRFESARAWRETRETFAASAGVP